MLEPLDRIALSVVLPAYQEEENLRIILPQIRASLQHHQESYEVLVIDTAEPLDATERACEQFEARHVRRQPSNSYGDAVRTGIEQARGTWILFMDADGSHDPTWIPRLLAERDGNEVVIASRYTSGGGTQNSPALILMSMVLNLTYAWVLGLKVKDVSNSYKLYRASLLRELRLTCDNFDIIEEVLFRIQKRHPEVRMKEVPFTFKTRMFGRTKRNLVYFMASYILTMLRLRFLRA